MDEHSLRTYLQSNSTWNTEDIDHFPFISNCNGDRFLDNHVHFPSETRSVNLNQMVSNLVEDKDVYQSYETLPMVNQSMHYVQRIRNFPCGTMKIDSSCISESGYPRNIPDSSSTQHYPPKDIQILVRQNDPMGMNPSIKNVTLQQFRQMIGLQRSSGLTGKNDRKPRHLKQSTSIPVKASSSAISTPSLDPACDIDLHRRTGVADTLYIGIEKCYEQLNYIRDSYAETESKIGIPKSSFLLDILNSNLANTPSRIDRLITEYQYEYNRIIRLHERIQEEFHIQNIEATRQTLDEWFNAIQLVHDRRRQEDVLQLSEALRVLCITSRKIRTVLWYWLYWSTNSHVNHQLPLYTQYQDEHFLYPSMNSDLLNLFDVDLHGKNSSNFFNENNKENQYSQ